MIVDHKDEEDLKSQDEDKTVDESSTSAPSAPPPAYPSPNCPASSTEATAADGTSSARIERGDTPPPQSEFDPAFAQDVKRSSSGISDGSNNVGSSSSRAGAGGVGLHPTLPVLLPPLYPPSPASPFLVAYPPSLAPIVPKQTFFAFLHALNEALAPSAFERTDRALRAAPALGFAYGITKGVVGGLTFGLAKAAVSAVEGGQGKIGGKLTKAQDALFGRTTLPSRVHSLLASANSPSGLFPPSSNLQLVLVPFAYLPRVLRSYTPLDHLPASAIGLGALMGVGDEKAAERKALRVRRRIDYRLWAWVDVTDDDGQRDDDPSSSRSPSKQDSPSRPTSTQKQPSFLAHVDHKLAARDSRRRGSQARSGSGVHDGGSAPESGIASGPGGRAGYALDDGMGGADDVLFLVVCRRDVDLTR